MSFWTETPSPRVAWGTEPPAPEQMVVQVTTELDAWGIPHWGEESELMRWFPQLQAAEPVSGPDHPLCTLVKEAATDIAKLRPDADMEPVRLPDIDPSEVQAWLLKQPLAYPKGPSTRVKRGGCRGLHAAVVAYFEKAYDAWPSSSPATAIRGYVVVTNHQTRVSASLIFLRDHGSPHPSQRVQLDPERYHAAVLHVLRQVKQKHPTLTMCGAVNLADLTITPDAES